ncbi:MAG TPA: methylated-DNA--[protein]-cysteine S-methyltransferase [Steroidobacteraceae bacterium]|jgi:methylated-DNA-[protein]-cysteine S-methyltransferase|nr:methylated-DNA--[protein]-cysteine S-methyltransferase [Steroidobacteraceae bacterium]
MNSYTYLDSPIGKLLLSTDGEALTGIHMHLADGPAPEMRDWACDADAGVLPKAARQLEEYFAGKRREFDLPTRPSGTTFQRLVWRQLMDIGYGETWSYGKLAQRIGNPNASRAVGLANGRNPLPVLVPCHRVIGADGSLTGYGGGLERKRWLLAHEGLY